MVDANGSYLHARNDDGDCNTFVFLSFVFFPPFFLIVCFVHGFNVEND
jgi:nitrate reductase NapE component